jgi:hypothetical protein
MQHHQAIQQRQLAASTMQHQLAASTMQYRQAIQQQQQQRHLAVSAIQQQRQPGASTIQQQQEQPPQLAASAMQHQQAVQQRQLAASTMRHQQAIQQQQQQHDLFATLYGELVAEARSQARECRIDVRTIVVRRDGGALRPGGILRDDLGIPPEVRAMNEMQKLVKRDVSAISTTAELARHAEKMQALRAAVVRKLQGKEAEKAQAAADGEANVKRKPEEDQEMLDAGCKIRKVECSRPH